MLAESLAEHDDAPVDDKIVVLHGATWADYQRLLELRGDASVPRIAYLEGALEIMTPSRTHESLKSRIGRLVEVFCLEKSIEFSPYGPWTLESKEEARGIEPDECYVFGSDPDPERPDLAIEVVWTSGGVAKLERGRLTVYELRGATYETIPASHVLKGIDLAELARYLDGPTASQSIREYRTALEQRR
jgi:Uma2 family endonuclease